MFVDDAVPGKFADAVFCIFDGHAGKLSATKCAQKNFYSEYATLCQRTRSRARVAVKEKRAIIIIIIEEGAARII